MIYQMKGSNCLYLMLKEVANGTPVFHFYFFNNDISLHIKLKVGKFEKGNFWCFFNITFYISSNKTKV